MYTATTIAQVRLNRGSPTCWRVTLDNLPLNLVGPDLVLKLGELVAALDELTGIPQGPTDVQRWTDIPTRAPRVSIALTRDPMTENGSELPLACDVTFASRGDGIISQGAVGAGFVAGGAPKAQLPRLMGKARAPEGLPLATRIASFDRWVIAKTKRLMSEAKRALSTR